MNRRRPLWLPRLALVLVTSTGLIPLVSGCGGSSKGDVHGNVTYKNKPVTGGEITFYDGEKAVQSTGIDATGKYSAKGLPPGKLTVTVDTSRLIASQKELKEKMEMAKKMGKKLPDVLTQASQTVGVPIPPKYANQKLSGLKVEVKSGTDEEQHLTLVD
jgi:hypothetical protein